MDDIRNRAEDVQAGFDTLRVLLDSVNAKVSGIVTEKCLTGALGAVTRQTAMDIQVLLNVAGNYIWQMDKDQSEVVRLILENEKENVA